MSGKVQFTSLICGGPKEQGGTFPKHRTADSNIPAGYMSGQANNASAGQKPPIVAGVFAAGQAFNHGDRHVRKELGQASRGQIVCDQKHPLRLEYTVCFPEHGLDDGGRILV
jgi:hypothetical protein